MDTLDRNRKAICAAFRDLTDACGGNVRAAKITGANASLLSKYGFDHYNEMPRLDIVAIMEADCKDPIVTRAMAELAGFTIVKQEPVILADAFVQDFSEIAQNSGATLSSIGAGMADGRFDGKDARASLPVIRKLIETATGIEHRLEQVEGGAEVVELRTKATA